MSRILSRLPLDASTRRALVEALKLKLPPGQPMTLEAVETATVQLLRELGPQLMEEVLQGVETDSKKGALFGAAATRRGAKGRSRAPSPPWPES